MFHIKCKISGDRIKEPMTNLALLERLGFLQELDICHYTGKIFVWSEMGVKIGRFSSFLQKISSQDGRCFGQSRPISRQAAHVIMDI